MIQLNLVEPRLDISDIPISVDTLNLY